MILQRGYGNPSFTLCQRVWKPVCLFKSFILSTENIPSGSSDISAGSYLVKYFNIDVDRLFTYFCFTIECIKGALIISREGGLEDVEGRSPVLYLGFKRGWAPILY